MKSYAIKKHSQVELISRREQYQNALNQYQGDSDTFYRELADTIRNTAKGKENAKPAGYFANLLAVNEEQHHGIATTIGVCGDVAHGDEMGKVYGVGVSNGIVQKYFPDLRRDVQTVTKYYAEVDKNGNIIGPVKEHSHTQYVYYTV